MAQRKHRFSAEVIARGPDAVATKWRGRCGRHDEWVGESYEAIEDAWRRHVYGETGHAPAPQGDKVGRWFPEAVSR